MKENKDMEKNLSTENTAAKPKKKSKLVTFLKSRNAKKGTLAIVLTVLFIAAVVGLNIIAKTLTTNYPVLSHDLTSSNVFELTETSTEYLKDLEKDITIYVLTQEDNLEGQGGYYSQVNKLLHQFEQKSKHIDLQYIDLASSPAFAAKYTDVNWNANSYLLLIEYKDEHIAVAQEDIFTYDEEALQYGEHYVNGQKLEQAVLTAILNITTEEKVGVTVLTGNGEIEETAIISTLTNNAYDVETVNLLNAEISEDSQFVILFAPKNDIDDEAYNTLVDWLYNDGNYGHTLFYVPNDMTNGETPNIDMLLEEWGMAVTKGLIWETDTSYMTNSAIPNLMSIMNYDEAEFTDTLKDQNVPVVMMYTMPVELIDSAAVSLLSSSDKAVVMPLDADENWDAKSEESGKLVGAAMCSKGNDDNTKSSNVIVFGSYDALSSSSFSISSFNNNQYFVNIFNTISHRDDIALTIQGKTIESQELGITNMSTATILGIVFFLIIPLAVVVVGIVMWVRRRHR